jgi:hypothetical protein
MGASHHVFSLYLFGYYKLSALLIWMLIYTIYYIILWLLCQYHLWLEAWPLCYCDGEMHVYVMAL